MVLLCASPLFCYIEPNRAAGVISTSDRHVFAKIHGRAPVVLAVPTMSFGAPGLYPRRCPTAAKMLLQRQACVLANLIHFPRLLYVVVLDFRFEKTLFCKLCFMKASDGCRGERGLYLNPHQRASLWKCFGSSVTESFLVVV